ncbi:MAG: hypothetical protein JWO36_6140 [Myxococcales bacterium]|nr:hypothetical protein [Myxococcales bacterium]
MKLAIEVLSTADPIVPELVEHRDAVGASAGDVLEGVQHDDDALVAVAHGNPSPAWP